MAYGPSEYNQFYVINKETNEKQEVFYMLRFFFVNNYADTQEDIVPDIPMTITIINPYLADFSIKGLKRDAD